jgi:hypothetical protein
MKNKESIKLKSKSNYKINKENIKVRSDSDTEIKNIKKYDNKNSIKRNLFHEFDETVNFEKKNHKGNDDENDDGDDDDSDESSSDSDSNLNSEEDIEDVSNIIST